MTLGDEQWSNRSKEKAKEERAEKLQKYWEAIKGGSNIPAGDLENDLHDAGPGILIECLQDRTFFHPGSGGMYRVKGFTWDSGRDRWLVRYVKLVGFTLKEHGDQAFPAYSHLPEDFLRPGRFLEVKS